ncbi:biotin/lipoyl-binding protein [Aceticella autotrophica]|uniref:Biotin/lipoyl-binding protein n=2 Tax=Aceticella autotrophica TaxID=2755338 RepID=A0A974Y3V6_9THEO|nr:biotin/lipoyl-binding protein [Aceticella autotrophica]
MKNMVFDIKEFTDSREIMESRVHPFTVIFIYILISIIIAAFIWSYLSEKEIVVNADGIIRPYIRESIIVNKITGNVEKVFVKDGDKVKKGETIYSINHKDLDFQKLYLSSEKYSKFQSNFPPLSV